jgi:hypothetical protein
MTDADRLAAIEARASIARTRTYGEWPVAYDEDATYLLRRLREVEAERDEARRIPLAEVVRADLAEDARDAAEADAARWREVAQVAHSAVHSGEACSDELHGLHAQAVWFREERVAK